VTTVRDVMTPDVIIVRPSHTIDRISRLLRDQGIGSVIVCDGIKLQGMVTDRDIVVKVIALGRDPAQTTAAELVEGTPVWIPVDADISEAQRLMAANQIRRLPVIQDKRLVGIVSLADLARADDPERTGRTIGEISAPE